jgi:LysR family glycine cleavage system transcriptional activator
MAARLPSLNGLRYFEVAARHLSFKLAAAELSVTPTAVSHQIRDLEAWFGRSLFLRHPRQLELTPAGQALFPKVNEAIGCLFEAVDAARAPATGAELTVTAPPTFASRWLVPRLASFTAQHAEVVLHLNSSLETIDDARREGIPFGVPHSGGAGAGTAEAEIRFGLGAASPPGYLVEPLLATDYVLVCAASMLHGASALRSPADVRACVLLHDDSIPDERLRPSWQEWCARAQVDLDLASASSGPHFHDSGMVLAAVANGMGVALMARQLLGPDLAAGGIATPFDIAVPSVYRYYLVVEEPLAERPEIRAFRDWIKREAGLATWTSG